MIINEYSFLTILIKREVFSLIEISEFSLKDSAYFID